MNFKIEKSRLHLNNIVDTPKTKKQKGGIQVETGFLKKMRSFFKMTVTVQIDDDKLTLNKRSFKKYVQRNLDKIETTAPKKQKEKLTCKKALEFFDRLKGGSKGSKALATSEAKRKVSHAKGPDSKVVLKHFPNGFGTDTSQLSIGAPSKPADGRRSSYDFLFKILITGKEGSGVNRLKTRICTGSFEKESEPANVSTHTLSCKKQGLHQKEEKTVKFQLSTLTNSCLTSATLRGCHAVVLTFDLTKPLNDSEQLNQLNALIAEVKCYSEENLKVVLVGTKVDSLEKDPNAKAKLQALESLATSKGFYYCATSAIDENGQEQFLKLLTHVTALELLEKDSQSTAPEL